jgi:hypothetical protein
MDEMQEGDKVIKCVDCRTEFIFTKGEQEFYAQKGFGEPKRCKVCRPKARAKFEKKA